MMKSNISLDMFLNHFYLTHCREKNLLNLLVLNLRCIHFKSQNFSGFLSQISLERSNSTGGTKTRNLQTSVMHASIIQIQVFLFGFYARNEYQRQTQIVREMMKWCVMVCHA